MTSNGVKSKTPTVPDIEEVLKKQIESEQKRYDDMRLEYRSLKTRLETLKESLALLQSAK